MTDDTEGENENETLDEEFDESEDPGLVDNGRRYRTLSIGNNATKRRP